MNILNNLEFDDINNISENVCIKLLQNTLLSINLRLVDKNNDLLYEKLCYIFNKFINNDDIYKLIMSIDDTELLIYCIENGGFVEDIEKPWLRNNILNTLIYKLDKTKNIQYNITNEYITICLYNNKILEENKFDDIINKYQYFINVDKICSNDCHYDFLLLRYRLLDINVNDLKKSQFYNNNINDGIIIRIKKYLLPIVEYLMSKYS